MSYAGDNLNKINGIAAKFSCNQEHDPPHRHDLNELMSTINQYQLKNARYRLELRATSYKNRYLSAGLSNMDFSTALILYFGIQYVSIR